MLILRTLWPYALCLLIGAFCAYKVQEWRWEADVNAINQRHDDAILQAERDARKIEQNMQTAIDNLQAKSNERETQYEADLAAANELANSLRDTRRKRTKRAIEDTGTAGSCEAARKTLIVYSELLDRAQDRDREVSDFADRAYEAGMTCMQSYEAIRGTE